MEGRDKERAYTLHENIMARDGDGGGDNDNDNDNDNGNDDYDDDDDDEDDDALCHILIAGSMNCTSQAIIARRVKMYARG
jgi:hypothetical protein